MERTIKFFLLTALFFCFQNVHALDIEITRADVDAYLGGNYTRGSHFTGEIAGIGSVQLNNTIGFRGGLSIGRTLIDTDINIFVSAEYYPFKKIPLSFSVAYIYNGLPEYEAHTNSLIPYISYKAKIAGVSLGFNCRFSSYFGGKAQFESVLSLYGYINFLNTDKILMGIGCGNLKDFHANNLGALSLNLFAKIPIAENIALINDLEYMQSGMDGLTATLYKVSFRAGVNISW